MIWGPLVPVSHSSPATPCIEVITDTTRLGYRLLVRILIVGLSARRCRCKALLLLRERQADVTFLTTKAEASEHQTSSMSSDKLPNLSATKSHHPEREKKITCLQDMQINHQQCKLPLVRVWHCLPTSHFAPEMIKKKKNDQKDENKEWRKYSNTEKGASHPLRSATLGATQTCYCDRCLPVLVRHNQPGKHMEELWIQGCSGKRCRQPTSWQFPFGWSTHGISQLEPYGSFAAANLLCWIRS